MQTLKITLVLTAMTAAVLFAAGCGDDTEPDCTPVCAIGQECGGDGCGGFCGTDDGMCAGGLACDGTACIEDPCPEGFVLVPAWTFTMGSPDNEPGRVTGGGDETAHKVTISRPFCMADHEVTNAEWKSVTDTEPSFFADAGDDVPVQNINWYDAIRFLNMKSASDGLTACYETTGESGTFAKGCVEGQIQCGGDFLFGSVTRVPGCTGYRLPTEAEWELAARAGVDTDPEDFQGLAPAEGMQCQTPNDRLDETAWFCGNAAASYASAYDCHNWSPLETCGPQPVKTKSANRWGLYDMLGNVFEFCQDHYWWHTPDHQVDPLLDDPNGYNRIIRGGSWAATAAFARYASRAAMASNDRGDVGLRMVVDVPGYEPEDETDTPEPPTGAAKVSTLPPPATGALTVRSGDEAMPLPEDGTGVYDEEVVFAGPTYRVVSFNLMCSVCGAGYDTWEERLVYFRDMFATIDADLIGLQEIVFDFEVDQVLEKLPGYAANFYKGDGADFFPNPDATVLYRTERFDLIDSGLYWLSPTPDVPWSLGYSDGQTLPRMVSWVKLYDKQYYQEIYFATTHFDSTHPHQENSAPQVIETTAEWAALAPVILTGDFNTEPRDPAFDILTNGIDAQGFKFFDAFEKVGNYWNREFNTDTCPAYDPINRIDHIFAAGADWQTKFWWVDLRKFGPNTYYPSDHRLIWADLVQVTP